MSHEFQEIEDGALDALETLKDAGLRTLEVYAGQLNVADLEDLVIQFPCCYVIAAGLEHEYINRRGNYTVELTVIIGDRNLRGVSDLTRGDASSPGIYRLLELARAALKDVRASAGWAPLRFRGEATLVYAPEESVCLYVSRYDTITQK